jgi:predicted ester cyclase
MANHRPYSVDHESAIPQPPNIPCTGRRWRGPEAGRVFQSPLGAASFTTPDGTPAAPVTVPLGRSCTKAISQKRIDSSLPLRYTFRIAVVNLRSSRARKVPMTHDSIKLVYPRIAHAVNTRQLTLLDTLYHPDLLNHGADPDEPKGAYHFKHAFATLIAACPDLHVSVDDQIAEGDKVVVRWRDTGTHTGAPLFGVAATGKTIILTGIDILRIRDAVVVERWAESDMLYVLETLGIR